MNKEYTLNNNYHNWIESKKVADSGRNIIHVNNIHSIIKIFGYLKYIERLKNKNVYVRGQSNLWDSLKPSIYRKIKSQDCKIIADSNISRAIDILKNTRGVGKINEFSIEPILQHYGINTTWLDLVDNIWVAVWFAINKRVKNNRNYKYILNNSDYGYLYFISVDSGDMCDGIFSGKFTETIDLRIAAPSYFGRPHAQHSILFRSKDRYRLEDCDYERHVCGVIRFNLKDACKWLGSGDLVSQAYLFPSKIYDDGYKKLLNCDFSVAGASDGVGGIDLYEDAE